MMGRIIDDIRSQANTRAAQRESEGLALAYVRVSHEDSRDRGASEAVQRKDIAAFAVGRGIQITEWYEDLGLSAYKEEHKRVGFREMIGRAQRDRSITHILVWKSDRFARNKYLAAATKGELARKGIWVLSVTELYDPTTREGVLLEGLADAMSQVRSMDLSELIHRSLLQNAECRDPKTGWVHKNGGMAQFGYRNHRIYADTDREYQRISHCIWLPDEKLLGGRPVWEWARALLLDWRLGQGLGYKSIAYRLTAAGIPSPRHRTDWTQTSVYYLLQKDKLLQYAGYALYNRRSFQNGHKRPRDSSEWVIIADAHPAIITEDEADAIYALAQSRYN